MMPSVLALLAAAPLLAVEFDRAGLEAEFKRIAAGVNARIGVCVQSGDKPISLNAGQRYSIQSVMKLLVGLAVMDAVDHKGWKLDTKVHIDRKDLSVFQQPIADKLGPNGYDATLGELVESANMNSDSAAADILVDRLGGIKVVQDYLRGKGITGVRIDRNERDLQTEIAGLRWRPQYVDAKVLDHAIAAVPREKAAAAYLKYKTDPRDTATPEGMAELLWKLSQGKLLSPASTKYMLNVLQRTATGADRLKAGVSSPWLLGHKTGTSSTFEGLAVATNDVGILSHPNGGVIAIAVFVADARENPAKRAGVMADIARATLRFAKK